MNYLIDKAKLILCEYPDSNHISFIMRKNTIICWGVNKKFKTDPLAKKFNHRHHTLHSEISTIKKFPYPIKLLPKYKMVNVRIKNSDIVGLSKPCKPCQCLLYSFDVRQIYYTTPTNTFNLLCL